MTLESANKHLYKTSLNLPFNTFTKINDVFGEKTPDSVGGSCTHHARRLMGLIVGARPLSAAGRRKHWGVQFTDSGDRFYADSSHGMMRAANLTRVKNGETVVVDTFPIYNGEPSKMAFKPGGEDNVVDVTQTIATLPHSYIHKWSIDLSSSKPLPQVGDRGVVNLRADSLHLGTFMSGGGIEWLKFNTLEGCLSVFGRNADGAKNRSSFLMRGVLERMSTRVDLPQNILIEIMEQANARRSRLFED